MPNTTRRSRNREPRDCTCPGAGTPRRRVGELELAPTAGTSVGLAVALPVQGWQCNCHPNVRKSDGRLGLAPTAGTVPADDEARSTFEKGYCCEEFNGVACDCRIGRVYHRL
jgi:hypothetical protein